MNDEERLRLLRALLDQVRRRAREPRSPVRAPNAPAHVTAPHGAPVPREPSVRPPPAPPRPPPRPPLPHSPVPRPAARPLPSAQPPTSTKRKTTLRDSPPSPSTPSPSTPSPPDFAEGPPDRGSAPTLETPALALVEMREHSRSDRETLLGREPEHRDDLEHREGETQHAERDALEADLDLSRTGTYQSRSRLISSHPVENDDETEDAATASEPFSEPYQSETMRVAEGGFHLPPPPTSGPVVDDPTGSSITDFLGEERSPASSRRPVLPAESAPQLPDVPYGDVDDEEPPVESGSHRALSGAHEHTGIRPTVTAPRLVPEPDQPVAAFLGNVRPASPTTVGELLAATLAL